MHGQPVAVAEPLELVAVQDVLLGCATTRAARRVARRCRAAARWRSIAISGTTPEPPPTSSSGPPSLGAPGEVPADRAAQLELVAVAHLAGQVRRDLAVVDRARPSARAAASSGADAIEYERCAW